MSAKDAVERAITSEVGEGPLADALRATAAQACCAQAAATFLGPRTEGFVLTIVGGVPTFAPLPAPGGTYAEIYGQTSGTGNPGPSDYAASTAIGAPFPFPKTKANPSGLVLLARDETGAVGSAQNSIVLPLTGRWLVYAEISAQEPAQIAVALSSNGNTPNAFVFIPSTVVGQAAGTNELIIDSIIDAVAGNVIQIQNNASAAAVNVGTAGAPGGGTNAIAAVFRVQYLGP